MSIVCSGTFISMARQMTSRWAFRVRTAVCVCGIKMSWRCSMLCMSACRFISMRPLSWIVSVLKRLLGILPVVFGVLLLTFLLVHLVPGDPVEVMLGESASSADKNQLRSELGLDKPLVEQFSGYIYRLAQGDFGVSIHSREPVSMMLAERIPATMRLAALSLLIAIAIGLPLGILAALHADRWADRFATFTSLTFAAMPHFWLGPLL